MGITASLVAQGRKDRALLALKSKKLQVRLWAQPGRRFGAVHGLTLLSRPSPPGLCFPSFTPTPHSPRTPHSTYRL